MRKPVVLITGAGGEIGHGLITRLSAEGTRPIVTLDLKPLEAALAPHVARQLTGSILDRSILERLLSEFEIDTIFHLAALLSTRGEFTPVTAHQVNVEGTLNLLEFAQNERQSHGRPVTFLYPSSIAAYGMPDLAAKARVPRVPEDAFNQPDDDVRLQQALRRAPRPVLLAALQAALLRNGERPRGFPRACASPDSFPRSRCRRAAPPTTRRR